MTGTVSQALLTVNSSINFLMYPCISKDFQSVFKQYIAHKMNFILGCLDYWKCQMNIASSNGSTSSLPDSCPATVRLGLPTTPMLEDPEDTSINLAELPNQAVASSEEEDSNENHTCSSYIDETNKVGSAIRKLSSVRLVHSMSLDNRLPGRSDDTQLIGISPSSEKENHIDQAISRCWISPIRRLSLIQFAKGDFI